ncbi:hypothetical protein K461DRAFT_273548 [Myriangium duriaei CBS 260.36]|uniref:GAT domain-containing protein n=1 Tax=Myriangium duriaei CBS 260.36 TaxID=1168546 RepID=A0A9P4JC50_9PEZI|nr:hypothetical protein K461DRAFT_273548 [Myriangium duriaei CBS 260.36]
MDESPEATTTRTVRLFCESGSPDNQGEEVLHLPVIVEAAESSPAAASAAAYQIRKFLNKSNFEKPHIQYNAVMLMRILCENPGPAFTKNIDPKFVDTVAILLRTGRDPSVQQIMRETLDALEVERAQDPGLKKLIEMWRLNKGFNAWFNVPSQYARGAMSPNTGGPPARNGRAKLPPPVELASRVEESRNSAKILIQLVQSTPMDEILVNDLVKEFAERCQNAQRSMQTFIGCDDPAPDSDTLQTLIEVSEQLSLSLSKHQRAVLNARRALGLAAGSARGSPAPESQSQFATPSEPVYGNAANPRDSAAQSNHLGGSGKTLPSIPALTPETRQGQGREAAQEASQDPFSDNAERSTWQHAAQHPRDANENTAYELPAVSSGANGSGPQPTPQPVVYRY